MEVVLAVTKSCHHCSIIEKELGERGIPYAVRYVEDHPELVERYGLKHSPNVIVDDELVFRGMPAMSELQRYFDELKMRER